MKTRLCPLATLVAVLSLLSSASGQAEETLEQKIARFNKPGIAWQQVRQSFGDPETYVWANETFTSTNDLPEHFLAKYTNGVAILVSRGVVLDFRSLAPGPGFEWRGVKLGSPMDEVLAKVGQPDQVLAGQIGMEAGVLYKDIQWKKGRCLFMPKDRSVRFMFDDDRVNAIFVIADADGMARLQSERPRQGSPRAAKRQWFLPPTRDAGPVEWAGSKIRSRVLPYPDFVSFFIRLPIAHAVATGKGVHVCVLEPGGQENLATLVRNIAPSVTLSTLQCPTNTQDASAISAQISKSGARIVAVPPEALAHEEGVLALASALNASNISVVIPSDASEDPKIVSLVNRLHAAGALTAGRVNWQSMVSSGDGENGRARLYNAKIAEIRTDVFCAEGFVETGVPMVPAATAAGVAALVLEKWPELKPSQIREGITQGARSVWQATSIITGRFDQRMTVDPVTTHYSPARGNSVFRFKALDAAGALGVDTEIPWFLNMLNCTKAWEITKGENVVAVISDQGFHTRHPELVGRIKSTQVFGPVAFESPEQNFHGTAMSRILLSVAPRAQIVPVLCSPAGGDYRKGLGTNIARSFECAQQIKADVVSSSWADWFNTDTAIQDAIKSAVASGVTVSWFHYPQAYPGVLRPGFVFPAGFQDQKRIGFADRLVSADPPGFYPVEIEAGLSATAPQAAGLAVLLKGINRRLTPAEIEELITSTATHIGSNILIPDAHKACLAALATSK